MTTAPASTLLANLDEYQRAAVESRFWAKVDRRAPHECWPWTAAHHPSGYGTFHVSVRVGLVKAHRLAYELLRGPIPPGMVLCHSCDNPPCVNPDRLSPGTLSDNTQDCLGKGRHRAPRGEAHRDARLTEAQVREIRAWPRYVPEGRDRPYLPRGERQRIASMYGISADQVTKILSGRKWRHVS